jgi:hypothetical protein
MPVQLDVGNFVSRSAFCGHRKMVKTHISFQAARALVNQSTSLSFNDVIQRLSKRKLVLITVASEDYAEGLIMDSKHKRINCYVILHEYLD